MSSSSRAERETARQWEKRTLVLLDLLNAVALRDGGKVLIAKHYVDEARSLGLDMRWYPSEEDRQYLKVTPITGAEVVLPTARPRMPWRSLVVAICAVVTFMAILAAVAWVLFSR